MQQHTKTAVFPFVLHALLFAGGAYFVYFAALARHDGWTDVFAATLLPSTALYLVVVGVVLVPLSFLGAIVPCNPRFNPFHIPGLAIVAILAGVAAGLGWKMHSDASAAYEGVMVSHLTSPPSIDLDAELLLHVTNLRQFLCTAYLEDRCMSAPASVGLVEFVQLKTSGREDPYKNITNGTLIYTMGFRRLCNDVPAKVQVFGSATDSAAKFRAACGACAQLPDRPSVTTLPAWVADALYGVSPSTTSEFQCRPSTPKSCVQLLLPKSEQTPTADLTPEAVDIVLRQITTTCLAIAITSTALFLVAIALIFLSRRQLGSAKDGSTA